MVAILESDIHVVVKRILDESKQGICKFISEIRSIGLLQHRNLVQLIGWCRQKSDLLLVYAYMPNDNLDIFLFDDTNIALNWE
ncbi:L-type lectin-domain containing receptor kinase S.4 [Linum grandiflorum]